MNKDFVQRYAKVFTSHFPVLTVFISDFTHIEKNTYF